MSIFGQIFFVVLLSIYGFIILEANYSNRILQDREKRGLQLFAGLLITSILLWAMQQLEGNADGFALPLAGLCFFYWLASSIAIYKNWLRSKWGRLLFIYVPILFLGVLMFCSSVTDTFFYMVAISLQMLLCFACWDERAEYSLFQK